MVFNPKHEPWNASWDGSTDDTWALQSCINDAIGRGPVDLPYGWGKISCPIEVNGPLTIRGQHARASGLILADPSQDGIIVQTVAPCNFRDFGIKSGSGSGQTAGRMMVFDPGNGSVNNSSRLRDLFLIHAYIGIHFVRAAWWQADAVEVNQFTRIGIHVQNLTHHDAGDSLIHGAVLLAKIGSTAECIMYESGSGLKITSCKILYGQHGILVSKQSGHLTLCDLIISGNSIEEQREGGACIIFLNNSGQGEWLRVHIIGNQFAPRAATGVQTTTPVAQSQWIRQLIITNNTFDGLCGSAGHAPCIDIDGATGAIISQNSIRSDSLQYMRPSYGILIRYYVDGYVGKNQFAGFMNGYRYAGAPTAQIDCDP